MSSPTQKQNLVCLPNSNAKPCMSHYSDAKSCKSDNNNNKKEFNFLLVTIATKIPQYNGYNLQ